MFFWVGWGDFMQEVVLYRVLENGQNFIRYYGVVILYGRKWYVEGYGGGKVQYGNIEQQERNLEK